METKRAININLSALTKSTSNSPPHREKTKHAVSLIGPLQSFELLAAREKGQMANCFVVGGI